MKYTARDYGIAARIVQEMQGAGAAAQLLGRYRESGIRYEDPEAEPRKRPRRKSGHKLAAPHEVMSGHPDTDEQPADAGQQGGPAQAANADDRV